MNHTDEGILRLEHVVKKFASVVAVNDISFTVHAGELFAFLGPNGAGKSTTIKMITTLLRSTSGKIFLNGHDVAHESDLARKSFGIVFQDPSVDNELTAYENMELHAVLYGVPKAVRKKRIDELLELLELDERANSLVKTFSGGMIRRLEIARGLLHQPKILFLDEPTLGLDTQTRALLWSYVKKLNAERGMTVFFSTHYLEEAESVATRIAMIDRGAIVAMGTNEELLKQTKSKTLEEAYLKLTGRGVRDEEVGSNEQFRMRARRMGR